MRKIKPKNGKRGLQLNKLLNGADSGNYADVKFEKVPEGFYIFAGTNQQLRIKQYLEADLVLKLGESTTRYTDDFKNKIVTWRGTEHGNINLFWDFEKNETNLGIIK